MLSVRKGVMTTAVNKFGLISGDDPDKLVPDEGHDVSVTVK